MFPYRMALLTAAVLAASLPVRAQDAPVHHDHAAMPPGMTMGMNTKQADCPDSALACASTATPFFAPDGSLTLAWASGGRIAVAHSTDHGAHFDTPILINPSVERLDSGPDSRPALVVDRNGRTTVAYAIFKDSAYNGEVFVTHSEPDRSFTQPTPITADTNSQRFVTMALDSDGRLFAAWLDKRDRMVGGVRNPDYIGAGLAWSWTDAAGTKFNDARIAVDNTCECCRIALAFSAPGRPVLLFRNVFAGSIRDHAVIGFTDAETPGPLQRVSEDNWKLHACPHHGPALAIDAAGTWHAAWFTQGAARKGVFYARSTDQGAHFSEPLKLGGPEVQAGRPTLLALHNRLYLAWKEFDGTNGVIRMMVSQDGGVTFDTPRIIAETAGGSDHPLLVSDGKTAFLSWLTQGQGYRMIALGDDS